MPKAPPTTRRRVSILADAIDMNAVVGRRLREVDLREIGNGTPLKDSMRRARELQEELAQVLTGAIEQDAQGLS